MPMTVPHPLHKARPFFQRFLSRSPRSTIVDSDFELDVNPGAIVAPQCSPFVGAFAPDKEKVTVIKAVVACKIGAEHVVAGAPAIVATTKPYDRSTQALVPR